MKINLGKIPYESDIANNKVEVELNLKQYTSGKKRNWEDGKFINVTGLYTFSCCGSIWGNKPDSWRHDIVSGGQNLDTIAEYIKTPLFKEIHRLWKAWHLNDLKAGIRVQDEAIEKWEAEGNTYDYTKICNFLKEKDLLITENYMYGHDWCLPVSRFRNKNNKTYYGNR